MSDVVSKYYNTAMDGSYRMSSTRRERVLSLLDYAIEHAPTEQISILDIGIGNGEIGKHCLEKWAGKKIYTEGVDIASVVLDHNKHLYTATAVVNVDDEDWTSAFDRKFDIVVVSEVLEHLFRPDLFLERVSNILAPHGVVLLTTPNLLLWSKRIKFLFGFHEYSTGGVFEWGHIHLFSWYFLQKLIRKNHFRILKSYNVMHPSTLNRWHRFLPGLFAFQFIIVFTRDNEK